MEDGVSESKGLKDRFGMGRLSMIMKDLEPLRDQLPMSMPSMASLSGARLSGSRLSGSRLSGIGLPGTARTSSTPVS